MSFFKRSFSFLIEIVKIVVIALVIVIPIRYFVFQPFFVRGQSMDPNFHHGDYLIIEKISFRFREIQRGEVIVFRRSEFGAAFIKRVIGLPGEIIKIEDGRVYLEGEVLNEADYLTQNLETAGSIEVILGEDEFFVLGDNRNASFDSRKWGALSGEGIIGRVHLRLWPMNAFALIETPSFYLERQY